ncbi:uncharacterized protein HD556DRAFT_1441108 [Suillus plorans]|uniref:Uncharacterized protein n=1 Tax=Suillus plorans TaxID=116603 RepID=A0A9P7DK89_9AGAM|nr:uncharacterized protein HD556DRAFT_1441108 [Suillus plorans]KAG1796934.1 hypothetical protein HD556DRAFT_1441108 [Suillus plorans]
MPDPFDDYGPSDVNVAPLLDEVQPQQRRHTAGSIMLCSWRKFYGLRAEGSSMKCLVPVVAILALCIDAKTALELISTVPVPECLEGTGTTRPAEQSAWLLSSLFSSPFHTSYSLVPTQISSLILHLGLSLPGSSSSQETPSSTTSQSSQGTAASRPMQSPHLPLPPSTQRLGPASACSNVPPTNNLAPSAVNQPDPAAQRCATKHAAIRARLMELEADEANGTHQLANAPLVPIPALFADPAVVDRARATAAAMHNEPKKIILPELVPGFKANLLDAIILLKVEDALKQYKYVLYMAITPAAHLQAARNGNEAFSFNT